MFENIDLKDAVRRAMQTEKNAMEFYQRGAEMMKNKEAKQVFELLAREEREHAEWFYNVYPGDDITDLQAFLNAGSDQDSDWMKELKAVKASDFKKTLTVVDRREAIKTALALSNENDIILIAGKGHEDYQELKGVKKEFSDKGALLELEKLMSNDKPDLS